MIEQSGSAVDNLPIRGASVLAGRVALTAVLCLPLGGCLALNLASRGAPEEEIREIRVELPPVDLPVMHGEHHEGGAVPKPVWLTIPESGYLHGFSVDLVDVNGDTVPSAAIHHFKVMDPDRRDLFAPVLLHLAGGGSETKPVDLPTKAGVPISAGDSLLFTTMLHNPTHHDIQGVTLGVTLRYTPMGPWKEPLALIPFFTQVTGVMAEPSFDLPPGHFEQSIEVQPAVSGWIIGLGGHLHKYGVLLRLEDVTAGKVLWERAPVRGAEGEILEVPTQQWTTRRGPSMSPDHVYRVTAVYENPTGEMLHDEGMGTLGGAFVPEEPWPSVDQSAEEYQWYLARELMWTGMPHMEHR